MTLVSKISIVTAVAAALSGGAVVLAVDVHAATTGYEAENSPAVCDGTIDSDHSGYSGTGFCNTRNATTVGGHTWNVYRGSNGHNAVYSFVRTSNTSSGTVDMKAICNWIKNRGWFGDVTIGNVQFGYEITSSAGGKNFVTNNLTITAT